MTAPELATVETFRIVSFDFDAARNIARFNYGFDDTHSFQEVVEFAGSPLGSRAGPGIESVLRLVHLAAGVSYYKAAAPGRIIIETGPLSRGEAGLVHDLYDKGLREFAVANGLEVPLQFEVEVEPEPGSVAEAAALGEVPASSLATGHGHDAPGEGVAVPIGGGKDSIVLVEALKATNPPPGLATLLVAVNPQPAMRRTADIAGLPLASITRTVSPRLLDLNSAGALNGHVPITAILSLIVVAAGYVYGYDTTLMALERSADEATSFVDLKAERTLARNLKGAFKGRTQITIAHRPHTVRFAYFVMVVDGGKVVEFGTHAELVRKRGVFSELFAEEPPS